MAYVALYRLWRPQDFDNLFGQEHIRTTLKNAISAGKIAHAYLFAGPRGTGKTTTAKILAKALNCAEGPTPTPCNRCLSCERITAGSSMDVFEIDAASNRGIDEIRDLREAVKFAPVEGRYKVYIIDEVHMLTTEAFNALLKTLEEPPSHIVFILATTEPHKIPATIHSRCQRYDFRRIPVQEIERRLTEVAASINLDIAPEAMRLIASHADGGLRDALSILDQCTALGEAKITGAMVQNLLGLVGHEWVWRLTDAVADKDAPAVLQALDELVALGKDVRQVLLELALHFRSLMLHKAAPDMTNLELYSEDREILAAQSARFSHDELVQIIQAFQSAANEAKWAPEPRITAEMALLSAARGVIRNSDIAGLSARVAALEAALARPSQPQPAHTPPQAVVRPAAKEAPVRMEPVKAEAAGPGPVKAAATAQPIADPCQVWEVVLKDLLAGGKRSVHACVSQGQLTELGAGHATVQFGSAFAKERSEKEDYRQMIESALGQIAGQPVRLICTLGTPARPKEKPAPATAKGPEEHHPALDQAIMMFGGKVIKEEKNGED
ncbi:MAG TPA: DNA polymerase III subunit gamma/tau [Selenomonadales bacterium]|nr:DNA polymerase III subunit gamma/tau [Selenomonadales bacterium]